MTRSHGAAGSAVGAHLRRDQMLGLIREREFARVAELSEHFAISPVTVRSDLAALARRGDVQRIFGGAIARSPANPQPPAALGARFAEEKVAIGHAAADLVRDGETLLIDAGTTALSAACALARRIELRELVVFTNGLEAGLALEVAVPRITVVLLGGAVHPRRRSLVGPLASLVLERINVDTLLLGCDGVDALGGVTSADAGDARVKARMLRAAARVVVLADGSKLGRVEATRVCSLENVDLVITGDSADAAAVGALREDGCDVLVGA
jgi:DeoR family transcriptional regulator, aga operon transcriptional repressor